MCGRDVVGCGGIVRGTMKGILEFILGYKHKSSVVDRVLSSISIE